MVSDFNIGWLVATHSHKVSIQQWITGNNVLQSLIEIL